MNIIDFIHSHPRIVIYGCGKNGCELLKLLKQADIEPDCFLVSDTETNGLCEVEGKEVFKFSNWVFSNKNENAAILIAVSMKYMDAIVHGLKGYSIPYYWLNTEDYQMLVRYCDPVRNEKIFLSQKPVSNLFGFDRGLPIDRWYIEQFLSKHTKSISNVNRVLEVGDNFYSKEYFPQKSISWDILDFGKGMDLTKKETLDEKHYDVFIATQVFNFIYDIKEAIDGAHYLLKDGGILLATVAGNIGQISWADMYNYGDWWRFTDISIKKLIQEKFGDNVKIETFGNAAIATAFVQGLAVEDLPDKSLLLKNDRAYSICIGIVAQKA